MYRWFYMNQKTATFLLVVPVCLILFFLFDLPTWAIIICIITITFLVCFLMNFRVNRLLLKAIKALYEQCDPYPLLKVTEDQLSYNGSKTYEPVLLIDRCLALRCIGEFEKALEQLEAINIEYKSIAPINKAIYYNNLADIYLCHNNLEKAESALYKSIQILDNIKNNNLKNRISASIQMNTAEIAYIKKDYDKSIELLNNDEEINMKSKVSNAFLFAKIYIAQNKTEEAKTKLQFVIDNGNKLNEVKIAEELLSKM